MVGRNTRSLPIHPFRDGMQALSFPPCSLGEYHHDLSVHRRNSDCFSYFRGLESHRRQSDWFRIALLGLDHRGLGHYWVRPLQAAEQGADVVDQCQAGLSCHHVQPSVLDPTGEVTVPASCLQPAHHRAGHG